MILTEKEIVRWGTRIGERVETPVFIALRGPLGAGKSVLARAIARGAGVEGPLPSPTFNLLFRYPTSGGLEVVHMDLYRLRDPEELWELGWDDIGGGRHGMENELVLVEWPERAGGLIPDDRWEIQLASPSPGSLLRQVKVNRMGSPPHLPGFPVSLAGR